MSARDGTDRVDDMSRWQVVGFGDLRGPRRLHGFELISFATLSLALSNAAFDSSPFSYRLDGFPKPSI